jgi:hypothetical protein
LSKTINNVPAGFKQKLVHFNWVEQEEGMQTNWDSKYHVVIINREQVLLPACDPTFTVNAAAFRAMPVPAAIVQVLDTATALARHFMAAQKMGTAQHQCP